MSQATVGYFTFTSYDETVVWPICDSCHKPIDDLKMGLFVFDDPNWDETKPAGKLGNRSIEKVTGKARFCHKGACDNTEGPISIELHNIFKADQRLSSEK